MLTVKDLLENEELMKNLTEDIEEIPEDSEVTYTIWALGYDKDDEITRDEVLIGEFIDPDAAVAYAKELSYNDITHVGFGAPDPKTAYFSVEVETVVYDPDDEDGGTMNIGTIYKRDIKING